MDTCYIEALPACAISERVPHGVAFPRLEPDRGPWGARGGGGGLDSLGRFVRGIRMAHGALVGVSDEQRVHQQHEQGSPRENTEP